LKQANEILSYKYWLRLYPKQVNRAQIIGFAAVFLIYFVPYIIFKIKLDNNRNEKLKNVELQLMQVDELPIPPPVEIIPPPEPKEPKKPDVATVKYLEPVAKPDEEVLEEVLPPTAEELEKSNPGLETREGKDSLLYDFSDVLKDAPVGDESVEVFTFTEIAPEFPGGMDALNRFISENIVYPTQARELNMQGVVIVQFVVEPDGSISGVEVARGLSYALDSEAKRVIGKMPNWNPGIQDGNAVRARFTLPIRFILQ
jgi:protein TonB